uniref:CCHC-type domain-containing protein n=1 Tax=Glossina palpalis gambiensis TaxID=67801 RepID=A0A1B0BXX7_9MUSC
MVCKDLTETNMVGPSRPPRMIAPTMINASRNVCLQCAQLGHFTLDCNNHLPGVLIKNCCRQNTGEHTQARGMTVNAATKERKPRTQLGSFPNLRRPVENRNCRHRNHQKYFLKRYNRFDSPHNEC